MIYYDSWVWITASEEVLKKKKKKSLVSGNFNTNYRMRVLI